MISAQIETAVSSGVRAPMSSPIGDISRSRSAGSVTPDLGESLHPFGVGLAAAHHADVADVGGERPLHGGHVELRVVGQDAHGVARSELGAVLVEHRGRPGDLDLVGHREAPPGGEHLAGVAHGHAVAEHLGDPRQRRGEVDRSEDPHLRRRGVRLDEHADRRLVDQVLRRGLPLGAVAADPGPGRLQLGERVAADDPVELGWPSDPSGPRSGCTSSLDPTCGPSITVARATGDVAREALGVRVEDRHQSSSSMNRWIVPPQVRPTANASSSE